MYPLWLSGLSTSKCQRGVASSQGQSTVDWMVVVVGRHRIDPSNTCHPYPKRVGAVRGDLRKHMSWRIVLWVHDRSYGATLAAESNSGLERSAALRCTPDHWNFDDSEHQGEPGHADRLPHVPFESTQPLADSHAARGRRAVCDLRVLERRNLSMFVVRLSRLPAALSGRTTNTVGGRSDQ